MKRAFAIILILWLAPALSAAAGPICAAGPDEWAAPVETWPDSPLDRAVILQAYGQREGKIPPNLDQALMEALEAGGGVPWRLNQIATVLTMAPDAFYRQRNRSVAGVWRRALNERDRPANGLRSVDGALRSLLAADHAFAAPAARSAWASFGRASPLVRLATAPTPQLLSSFLEAESAVDRALAARTAYRTGRLRRAALLSDAALRASRGRNRWALHERISVLIALGPALSERRAQNAARRVLADAERLPAGREQAELFEHGLYAATRTAGLRSMGPEFVARFVAEAAAEPNLPDRGLLLTWAIRRAAATPWARDAFRAVADIKAPTPVAAFFRIGLAVEVGETAWARRELAPLCGEADPDWMRSAGRLIERALDGEAVLPPVALWDDLDLFVNLPR